MRALLKKFPSDLILFCLGMGLYLYHFSWTSRSAYTVDLGSHIFYLRYIAEFWTLPDPRYCLECYHPPLYYIASAIFFTIGGYPAVRLFSLLLYTVYLYYARLLLKENLKLQPVYLTAWAMVLFWPSGVTKATMITNDLPLFMAQVGGFYYLTRWWKTQKQSELEKAFLWGALALNFKTSGIVSFAAIGLIVAYGCWKKSFTLRNLANKRFIGVVIITLLLGVSPLIMKYHSFHEVGAEPRSWMVSTVDPDEHTRDRARVDHDWKYLTFDIQGYFASPLYYDIYGDRDARSYFWNNLLKTSLFGRVQWASPDALTALNAVHLLMVIYMLAGCIFLCCKERFPDAAVPFAIYVTLQIAALWAFDFYMPFRSHLDYRHIFATTPGYAFLYAQAAEGFWLYSCPRWAKVGVIMGIMFALLAVLIVLLQPFYYVY